MPQLRKEPFIECLEGLKFSHELSVILNEAVEERKETLTQEQVSQRTGKSVSTIKRFESGKIDSLFLMVFYCEMFTKRNQSPLDFSFYYR